MWVVLSEDGVEFYKKKTDRSPKGMIPLKGATLVSPCQDFGKRTVRKCQIYMLKKVELVFKDKSCESKSIGFIIAFRIRMLNLKIWLI